MGVLYYGGTIYTMEKEAEQVEAVLVEEQRILATGNMAEIMAQYSPYIQETYELGDRVMLPGLVDSHMHLVGHGERLLRLDVSACASYEELLALVRTRAQELPAGEWIVGEGWDETGFSDRQHLHAHDLDEISRNHPILLKRRCRHAVLVNSYVLRKAGIHAETPDPKGGKIGRDTNGLTGLLYERAQELLADILPGCSDSYVRNALHTAIADCWKHGLVGCHTEDLNYYGSFSQVHQAFQEVTAEMPLKAHLLVHHEVAAERQGVESTRYVEFGAMKAFADGSLGGRTALLSEPYADALDTCGVAVFEREELAALVAYARSLGMTVAIHTIGDLSFEYIISALEQNPPAAGQRDRLIHCQVLRRDLIERAKHLPVILDIQPVFVTSDFPSACEKLGPERLRYAYAWKTLLQEGFVCAGGSDAPIEQVNPFLGIYGAVTRRSFVDGNCYMPAERLTMFEAVSLFTTGSAAAISKEHTRGKIQPGYDADFTIIDRDIFRIDPEEVKDTVVVRTIIDGITVYER